MTNDTRKQIVAVLRKAGRDDLAKAVGSRRVVVASKLQKELKHLRTAVSMVETSINREFTSGIANGVYYLIMSCSRIIAELHGDKSAPEIPLLKKAADMVVKRA